MNRLDEARVRANAQAAEDHIKQSDVHRKCGEFAFEATSIANALRCQILAMTCARRDPDAFERLRAEAQSMTYLLASRLVDMKDREVMVPPLPTSTNTPDQAGA